MPNNVVDGTLFYCLNSNAKKQVGLSLWKMITGDRRVTRTQWFRGSAPELPELVSPSSLLDSEPTMLRRLK